MTLKTLAEAPFNKIRFCVFPKSYYIANKNEPERFPFLKNNEGKFDFNRPDLAFWRHFEQQVLELQKLGIEADLILWHPYDRWGFAEMCDAGRTTATCGTASPDSRHSAMSGGRWRTSTTL